MKIDCSKTVNYLKESYRLCESYYHNCGKCPLHPAYNGMSCGCRDLATYHPEKTVEIVQKWSDEHPQKTRLEDLLEKYPNANADNVVKNICTHTLGYEKGDCDFGRCEDCWSMPV